MEQTYTDEEMQQLREWAFSNTEVVGRKFSQGKQTEAQCESLRNKKKAYENALAELLQIANHMVDIYKNVNNYVENHARAAEAMFNTAIESAASCVPDAGCQGLKLEVDDVHATAVVTTPSGFDVADIEGSGFGSILSVMLRYACLKAQPGALPLLILDEQVSTVSGTNINAFYDLLQAMARDINVVCIEQRGLGHTGLVGKTYTFTKQDGVTEVEESNEPTTGSED